MIHSYTTLTDVTEPRTQVVNEASPRWQRNLRRRNMVSTLPGDFGKHPEIGSPSFTFDISKGGSIDTEHPLKMMTEEAYLLHCRGISFTTSSGFHDHFGGDWAPLVAVLPFA